MINIIYIFRKVKKYKTYRVLRLHFGNETFFSDLNREYITILNFSTPIGSQTALIYDINVMRLIYDALDVMKITRDDADSLLKELSAEVPEMLTG